MKIEYFFYSLFKDKTFYTRGQVWLADVRHLLLGNIPLSCCKNFQRLHTVRMLCRPKATFCSSHLAILGRREVAGVNKTLRLSYFSSRAFRASVILHLPLTLQIKCTILMLMLWITYSRDGCHAVEAYSNWGWSKSIYYY